MRTYEELINSLKSRDNDPVAVQAAEELETLLRCLPQLEIQPASFQEAFLACRSYPGMGDLELKVRFNPYECWWDAQISFSDNTRYNGTGKTADEALKDCTRKFHEHPPEHLYDN